MHHSREELVFGFLLLSSVGNEHENFRDRDGIGRTRGTIGDGDGEDDRDEEDEEEARRGDVRSFPNPEVHDPLHALHIALVLLLLRPCHPPVGETTAVTDTRGRSRRGGGHHEHRICIVWQGMPRVPGPVSTCNGYS